VAARLEALVEERLGKVVREVEEVLEASGVI
jgi:hypothetical protein